MRGDDFNSLVVERIRVVSPVATEGWRATGSTGAVRAALPVVDAGKLRVSPSAVTVALLREMVLRSTEIAEAAIEASGAGQKLGSEEAEVPCDATIVSAP